MIMNPLCVLVVLLFVLYLLAGSNPVKIFTFVLLRMF